MKRVAGTGSDAVVDMFGTGKHGYTDGVPGVTAATVLRADCVNPFQEEIAQACEMFGITLSNDVSLNQQLATAIGSRDARLAILNATNRTPGSGYAGPLVSAVGFQDYMIAVGGGISSGGARIQRSTNRGSTWAAITPAGGYVPGQYFSSVAYSPGFTRVVVVGTSGQYSDDQGTTFVAGTNGNGNAVCYSFTAGSFCIVGGSGMKTSAAGAVWTSQTAAGGYAGVFYGVAANSTVFVAVGSGGEIQTSPTGLTGSWTKRTPDASYAGTFRSVCALSNETFIAVGSGGEIQSSTDNGVTWKRRAVGNVPYYVDAPFTGTFYSVASPPAQGAFGAASGRQFAVAAGEDGEVQITLDGASWVSCKSQRFITSDILGASYDQFSETVMLLGDGGLLRQSMVF